LITQQLALFDSRPYRGPLKFSFDSYANLTARSVANSANLTNSRFLNLTACERRSNLSLRSRIQADQTEPLKFAEFDPNTQNADPFKPAQTEQFTPPNLQNSNLPAVSLQICRR
jgi:hypothetical protein